MGCRTQQQLSVDVQNRIRSLSRDLPQLWADPAVIDRERKGMLALLIQDGTILSEDHSPPATAGGGECVRHSALSPISVALPKAPSASVHQRYYFWRKIEDELRRFEPARQDRDRIGQALARKVPRPTKAQSDARRRKMGSCGMITHAIGAFSN
jgi:hypothetical protein